MSMQYDVFISYSRKDTRMADRICAAFDRSGITYFIDRKGLSAGVDFPEVLAEAIESSRFFLFLGSAHSYASKYALNEVAYAFDEKPKNTVIPYLIDDAPLPKNLKFLFGGLNMRNVREHSIDILVKDILDLKSDGEPVPVVEKRQKDGNGRKSFLHGAVEHIKDVNPLIIVFFVLQLVLFVLLSRDFFPLFLKGYASKPPHHTVWWSNVALTACCVFSFIGTLGILAGRKSCFYAVCVLDVMEFILIRVISHSIFVKSVTIGKPFTTATYETLRVLGGMMERPLCLLLFIALLLLHVALMRAVLQLKKNGRSAWSMMHD